MTAFKDFIKGIIVGLGGIAPGLSGSVLMVILGLYEKTINAIGTIVPDFFKRNWTDFKKKFFFLVPLVAGVGIGILLFSKLVDYMLAHHEFGIRYLFLGLIIGTIPFFYKEVKKNGFAPKYYLVMLVGLLIGAFVFTRNFFPEVTNPNLFQSVILGVAYAGSSIIPGCDSAAILSSLGLYELWVSSVAHLDFAVLIPAAVGLGVGLLVLSFVMNFLIKKFYTFVFSLIFGLFLTIIPSVLTKNCAIHSVGDVVLAAVLIIIGFIVSYFLGDIDGNLDKLGKMFNKNK